MSRQEADLLLDQDLDLEVLDHQVITMFLLLFITIIPMVDTAMVDTAMVDIAMETTMEVLTTAHLEVEEEASED
jgi:hypothetical protein